jgi:hypothetical protein
VDHIPIVIQNSILTDATLFLEGNETGAARRHKAGATSISADALSAKSYEEHRVAIVAGQHVVAVRGNAWGVCGNAQGMRENAWECVGMRGRGNAWAWEWECVVRGNAKSKSY